MLDFLHNFLGYGCIAVGVFVIVSGSIGMLRFPNVFARLHAAGITDSLGCPLVLLGLIIFEGFTLISLKLFVLMLLLMLTSPTACYALAKAAFLGKDKK